jgi:hypothetical protein
LNVANHKCTDWLAIAPVTWDRNLKQNSPHHTWPKKKKKKKKKKKNRRWDLLNPTCSDSVLLYTSSLCRTGNSSYSEQSHSTSSNSFTPHSALMCRVKCSAVLKCK